MAKTIMLFTAWAELALFSHRPHSLIATTLAWEAFKLVVLFICLCR